MMERRRELRPLHEIATLGSDFPVRLVVEGTDIVGYGFSGQRVAMPLSGRGCVCTVWYYTYTTVASGGQVRRHHGIALLDGADRVLLDVPTLFSTASAQAFAEANRLRFERYDGKEKELRARLAKRSPAAHQLIVTPPGSVWPLVVIVVLTLVMAFVGAGYMFHLGDALGLRGGVRGGRAEGPLLLLGIAYGGMTGLTLGFLISDLVQRGLAGGARHLKVPDPDALRPAGLASSSIVRIAFRNGEIVGFGKGDQRIVVPEPRTLLRFRVQVADRTLEGLAWIFHGCGSRDLCG